MPAKLKLSEGVRDDEQAASTSDQITAHVHYSLRIQIVPKELAHAPVLRTKEEEAQHLFAELLLAAGRLFCYCRRRCCCCCCCGSCRGANAGCRGANAGRRCCRGANRAAGRHWRRRRTPARPHLPRPCRRRIAVSRGRLVAPDAPRRAVPRCSRCQARIVAGNRDGRQVQLRRRAPDGCSGGGQIRVIMVKCALPQGAAGAQRAALRRLVGADAAGALVLLLPFKTWLGLQVGWIMDAAHHQLSTAERPLPALTHTPPKPKPIPRATQTHTGWFKISSKLCALPHLAPASHPKYRGPSFAPSPAATAALSARSHDCAW